MLYMFCTDTMVAIFWAASSCSTFTSDRPMWRILPSCCSATSSPIWSSAGNFVVDAVQLEQVDGVHAETAQAHLAFLTQIGREAENRPHVGPGAQESGLRRDDDAVVRVQRFADQFLGDIRAVGVGGVDEVDAEFDGAAQDANAFVAVVGRTPDTLSGQAHGAESQAVHCEVAADAECSRSLSGTLLGHFSTVRRR